MKKIFIKTYGCALNQSDSELMAGFLTKSGRYEITDNMDESDLVIINSCTVKKKAETKFLADVRKINKPKLLAGCVVQAEIDINKFMKYSFIGTNDLNKITEAVDEILKGHIFQAEFTRLDF